MNRRFGRLPPLTSLEGFEASARLKSFSLASEELNITQSAVSHQIKALEAFFGLPLFNRVGRSVELTVAGMDFLETATRALDLLAQGKRRMDFYYRPGAVVWGTTPAFAGKWLVPRYSSLREWFPDIQPWLYTSDEVYDLKSQEVDLAIWFGDGQWSGVESRKLFHDHLAPLYAPHTMPRSKQLKKYQDLANHTLLHDERADNWLSWFHRVGHPELDNVTGCNFSDSGLALDCAADGQGVVLGSLVIAADMVAGEKLYEPFDKRIITADAYYLVQPAGQTLRPAVEKAKQWLLEEAEKFAGTMGFADLPDTEEKPAG